MEYHVSTTAEMTRAFMQIARRIAALLALGDALNASYHAVRQATVPLG